MKHRNAAWYFIDQTTLINLTCHHESAPLSSLPFLSRLASSVAALSLPRSDDGRQLSLFLLSGGPRGKEVRQKRGQAGVRPLPHQVLRQHLRRVSSTHPCGIKGASIIMYFRSSGPCSLNIPVVRLSSIPPSSIRSSAIRAGSGTRSVSGVQSVTSLWPKSPSAPRMIASCVGSAAPRRTRRAATAAINPSWLVRQQI